MVSMKDYIIPGISAMMLYPGTFDDENAHLRAVEIACSLPDFELLDMFFPEDPRSRLREMQMLRQSGKMIIVNSPPVMQQDGPFNPCADEPEVRRNALAFMKRHIEYAAEACAPAVVYTANVDRGEAIRVQLMDRFFDFACAAAETAQSYGILFVLEPMERHRFKRLFLGPTEECAAFVSRLQRAGYLNSRLMADMAHIPLMEEECDDAIRRSMATGLAHIHLGNAVLWEESPFYGHTHPPLGAAGGLFDTPELSAQLRQLIRHGFIGAKDRRVPISFEVQSYPDKTPEETATIHYHKLLSAFTAAMEV